MNNHQDPPGLSKNGDISKQNDRKTPVTTAQMKKSIVALATKVTVCELQNSEELKPDTNLSSSPVIRENHRVHTCRKKALSIQERQKKHQQRKVCN